MNDKKFDVFRTRVRLPPTPPKGINKMSKINQVIENLKNEQNLTTLEVLTKYPDLAKLLEEEEQREKLDESKSERALLKG